MDRKLKKPVNLRGYNLLATGAATAKQSDSFMQNSYVIPTNTTSMPPVNLPPPSTLAKDAAGLNQYHSPQYRSTRQRTNITTTQQQNANYNINTAAATTTHLQLTQQQLQSTTGQKIHNNNTNNNCTNNQTVMSAKAAACIASPMEQLAAVHAKATSSRNKNEGK